MLLADAQFERPAPEVTDCAALVRFAFREALRAHTPEWARRVALPFTPTFPDVRSGAEAGRERLAALPRLARRPARYAEFADARTLVALNARPLGRDVARCSPATCSTSASPRSRSPIT